MKQPQHIARGLRNESSVDNSPEPSRPGWEICAVVSANSMTRIPKRFPTQDARRDDVQRTLVKPAVNQFQYMPRTAAPFQAHMNARISPGVDERSFHSTLESTTNHKTPAPKNPLTIASWKNQ